MNDQRMNQIDELALSPTLSSTHTRAHGTGHVVCFLKLTENTEYRADQ